MLPTYWDATVFQFPREDAQGTTRMASLGTRQRVSIPPRRCSGDNQHNAGLTLGSAFQFPREDAQGTTVERLSVSAPESFNSPEKMLRGQPKEPCISSAGCCFNSPEKMLRGQLEAVLGHEEVSGFNSPEKMLRGQLSVLVHSLSVPRFNSPEKMLRGQHVAEIEQYFRSRFNSPEKMLRGQLKAYATDNNNWRFNSPEKMLRGQQIIYDVAPGLVVSIPPRRCSGDNLMRQPRKSGSAFQFPREDAQGTTTGSSHVLARRGFNSPEKMLRGQLVVELDRNPEKVSIPPRRCSGDNANFSTKRRTLFHAHQKYTLFFSTFQ